MKTIISIVSFLFIISILNAQNCPDNINNSPGNSPNTVNADVYDGNGDIVETIVCEATGNSSQLDCDLESFGYPSDYFILIEITNGSNSVTCAYGADGELLPNNPLPINLVEFKGMSKKDCHILSWKTESEKDNDYFTVQASIDFINWKTVGIVNGSGTDSNENNYSLRNNNVSPGVTYYRLVQTDFNGVHHELSIISLESLGFNIEKKGNIISVVSTKEIDNIQCFSITGAQVISFQVDAKEFVFQTQSSNYASFLLICIAFKDGTILKDKIVC